MTKAKSRGIVQDRATIEKIIKGLTLFDDDLMSRAFDQNIEATELLLRLILKRNIKVLSVNGQDEIKNSAVGGRNVILDVHALDEDGSEDRRKSRAEGGIKNRIKNRRGGRTHRKNGARPLFLLRKRILQIVEMIFRIRSGVEM